MMRSCCCPRIWVNHTENIYDVPIIEELTLRNPKNLFSDRFGIGSDEFKLNTATDVKQAIQQWEMAVDKYKYYEQFCLKENPDLAKSMVPLVRKDPQKFLDKQSGKFYPEMFCELAKRRNILFLCYSNLKALEHNIQDTVHNPINESRVSINDLSTDDFLNQVTGDISSISFEKVTLTSKIRNSTAFSFNSNGYISFHPKLTSKWPEYLCDNNFYVFKRNRVGQSLPRIIRLTQTDLLNVKAVGSTRMDVISKIYPFQDMRRMWLEEENTLCILMKDDHNLTLVTSLALEIFHQILIRFQMIQQSLKNPFNEFRQDSTYLRIVKEINFEIEKENSEYMIQFAHLLLEQNMSSPIISTNEESSLTPTTTSASTSISSPMKLNENASELNANPSSIHENEINGVQNGIETMRPFSLPIPSTLPSTINFVKELASEIANESPSNALLQLNLIVRPRLRDSDIQTEERKLLLKNNRYSVSMLNNNLSSELNSVQNQNVGQSSEEFGVASLALRQARGRSRYLSRSITSSSFITDNNISTDSNSINNNNNNNIKSNINTILRAKSMRNISENIRAQISPSPPPLQSIFFVENSPEFDIQRHIQRILFEPSTPEGNTRQFFLRKFKMTLNNLIDDDSTANINQDQSSPFLTVENEVKVEDDVNYEENEEENDEEKNVKKEESDEKNICDEDSLPSIQKRFSRFTDISPEKDEDEDEDDDDGIDREERESTYKDLYMKTQRSQTISKTLLKLRCFIDGMHEHFLTKFGQNLIKLYKNSQESQVNSKSEFQTDENRLDVISYILYVSIEESSYLPLIDIIQKWLQISTLRVQAEEEIDRLFQYSLSSWRSQSHCGIPENFHSPLGWTKAIDELCAMNCAFSPHMMLTCLHRAACSIYAEFRLVVVPHINKMKKEEKKKKDQLCHPLSDLIQNDVESSTEIQMPSESYTLGADDFLPIFIYVLAHSNLRSPNLKRDLMWSVCHPEMVRGEGGYYLTVFESALDFLKKDKFSNGELSSSSKQSTLDLTSAIASSSVSQVKANTVFSWVSNRLASPSNKSTIQPFEPSANAILIENFQ